MADDVTAGIGSRCYESKIGGSLGPANGVWGRRRVRVLGDQISGVAGENQ